MQRYRFIRKVYSNAIQLTLSLGILALFFTLPTALYAKTDVLFSPQGSIKETIIKKISSSEETIDIAAFIFTSGDIAKALYNARERGVVIRLVIDHRQNKRRYPVLEFLKEEGFDLQFLAGNIGGSANNTFAIFDSKFIVTGSYNWTEYAEKFNYENAVFMDDSDVIEKYKKEFDSLYSEGVAQGARRMGETGFRVDVSGASEMASAASSEGILSDSGNVPKIHTGGSGEVPDIVVSVPTIVTDRRYVKEPGEIQKTVVVIKPQKQFLNITFDKFDKIFGDESELDESEKRYLWKDKFEGKYVRWTGKIGYKGVAVYNWNKIGIRHKDGSISVKLSFNYAKQRKVLRLNVGNIITYTGKLVSLRGLFSQYRLDDVDVLQIR